MRVIFASPLKFGLNHFFSQIGIVLLPGKPCWVCFLSCCMLDSSVFSFFPPLNLCFYAGCLSDWTPYCWMLCSFSLLSFFSLRFPSFTSFVLSGLLRASCKSESVYSHISLKSQLTRAFATTYVFMLPYQTLFNREDSDRYMHTDKTSVGLKFTGLTPFLEDCAARECKTMKENVV